MKRSFAERLADVVLPTVFIAILLLGASMIAFGVYGGIQNEGNRIAAGEVIDKEVEAGYTSYHGDENSGRLYSHPTKYYLKIQGEKNGETVTYWREVTEEEYSRYSVGDWYGSEQKEIQP